jgi:enamine deaminase RidA (YjgF/YER057c/UK114 family)
MSVYDKLRALKITLPEPTPPVGAFVPSVRSGNLVFVSGHIAKVNGKPWVGRLGHSLTTAEGKDAARRVAIDLMGTLHAALGDLNLGRIVKLMVLVNSAPTFTEHHLVANGASELFHAVFGDAGTHVRSARRGSGSVWIVRGNRAPGGAPLKRMEVVSYVPPACRGTRAERIL